MKAEIELTETTLEVSSGDRVTRVYPHEGAFLIADTRAGAYEEVARCTTFPHAVWMALQQHAKEPLSTEEVIEALNRMPVEQRQKVLEELRCKTS